MVTTTVSDAIVLPQSQGTGLSGENATIDAAINGVLNRYVGGEYVATEYSTGLAFQNHDATNDTVEVGPGIVFIQDNSTSTGGERSSNGNPQAESSTTSGYDTELPEGHTYAVLLPTATQISVSDSTLNEVYVDIDDVTANNSVNLEHDGSSTASPGNTSLKIGETNPDDASADTRANDDASPTYSSLTVNGTTDTDALNATTDFEANTPQGTPSNPKQWMQNGEAAGDYTGILTAELEINGDNSAVTLIDTAGGDVTLNSGWFIVIGVKGDGTTFTDTGRLARVASLSIDDNPAERNTPGNRSYSSSGTRIELAIDDAGSTYDVVVQYIGGSDA